MERSEKNSIDPMARKRPILQQGIDVTAHEFADVTSMA